MDLGDFLIQGMNFVIFGVYLFLESGGFHLSFGVVLLGDFLEKEDIFLGDLLDLEMVLLF